MLRVTFALSLLLLGVCSAAAPKEEPVAAVGTLTRVVAIGGESTGWSIHFDSAATIEGSQLSSIEVQYQDTALLNSLANRRVTATGHLVRRQGVEIRERVILQVSSIQEASKQGTTTGSLQDNSPSSSLTASEWLLEDLAGTGVLDNIHATLAFPETGKVAGNGSCNRFFGTAQSSADSITFGPLGSTRMACPPAVMDQETRYLKALAAARRFEWHDTQLLLYSDGYDKPLRFTRKDAATAPDLDLTILFSKIWQVPGVTSSLYIFLPNGTLLETSCRETYRIATWTIDKSKPSTLRITEDGQLAFTATILELTNTTLRWQQTLSRSNEQRNVTLTAIEREFVCPDLPK